MYPSLRFMGVCVSTRTHQFNNPSVIIPALMSDIADPAVEDDLFAPIYLVALLKKWLIRDEHAGTRLR